MNIKQVTCSIAAFAAIASSAIAQGNVTVPAHTSVYNGFSRGYSTVAAVDFEISELEIPLDAFQPTDTASFLIQVNGADVYTDFGGTNAISVVSPPVSVVTGDVVMVIATWSGTPTSNFSAHNSYASGAAPYATTILGVAHTLDRAGYQCDVGDATSYGGGTANGGAASFTGIAGSIGRCFVTAQAPGGGATQMPIPGFGNTYTGNTRGFSFQAPVSGVIVGLSVPNENMQTHQVVEVTSWGTAGPTAWPTQTAPVSVLFYDNAALAGTTITVAIPLVAGEWYGILGSCHDGMGGPGSNSYGTPAGPYASSMLGVPCTLTRFLTQNGIATTGGNGLCATEGGGAIARIEVMVAGTGGGSVATVDTIGTGCISEYASLHQSVTLDVFAAANTMTGIDYINTGAGYLVTAAAGTFVTVGTVDPATVPVPGVGDDAVVPAGTLGLEFGSNGWIALGAGNSNGWSPTPAVYLNQPAAQFSFWSDFQPNTGGDINYEEAGTRALLTYTDVLAWGTSSLCTFQFDLDTATGNCSMYLGALASTSAHPTMIGYSPAGPNLDPGSTDIEAATAMGGAIILAGGDTAPLNLEGVGRPVMGATPTPYEASTTNIEAGALFHAGVIGLANPSMPLGIVGFPAGCTLYATADVLIGPAVVAGGPGNLTWTVIGLPIVNAAFNGVELYVAAATLDLSLVSVTSRSSNGLHLTLGDL